MPLDGDSWKSHRTVAHRDGLPIQQRKPMRRLHVLAALIVYP